MSDSQVAESVLERPSRDGQVERANAQKDLGVSDGRPSDNGQVAQEQDNIRKLQSTYDKRLAEERRAREAQQQQLQAYQQQAQQLQWQLDQMQEAAAPDDYSRLELKLQKAEQKLQQYEYTLQQQYQQQQEMNKRAEALNKLADKYQVDVDDLSKAQDYEHAVELAIAARDKRQQQQQQRDEQRAIDNRPDLGGGRASTTNSRWEDEYEEAKKRGDSIEMIRLSRIGAQKK